VTEGVNDSVGSSVSVFVIDGVSVLVGGVPVGVSDTELVEVGL
jgi:hypothetical protein